MDRKEFLALLGLGATAFVFSSCLNGCMPPDNPVSAPANVDFTLDLSDPANAALTKDGGYLYNGGVIVARISATNFVAVSSACTHQGQAVKYTGNSFYCDAHGSSFSTDGSRTAGPARGSLTKYNTALKDQSLHVFS